LNADIVIPTYKGEKYLPFLLKSIENQTKKPRKVIIILKKSNDNSENIIDTFRNKLNTEIIFQENGNFATALQLGIEASNSDVIMFTDDDAILENAWVEKYLKFFEDRKDAGGARGITFKAELKNSDLILTNENFYGEKPTKETYWRRPLPEALHYYEGISISGFSYRKRFDPSSKMLLSLLLVGVNMAFKSDAIKNINLAKLFKNKNSKAYWNESILAYNAFKRGFQVYRLREKSIAPIAWHIQNKPSLTRAKGFWNEFWIHYDRVKTYHRLKSLGAQVSLSAYLFACLALMRKQPFPRFLATIYAQLF